MDGARKSGRSLFPRRPGIVRRQRFRPPRPSAAADSRATWPLPLLRLSHAQTRPLLLRSGPFESTAHSRSRQVLINDGDCCFIRARRLQEVSRDRPRNRRLRQQFVFRCSMIHLHRMRGIVRLEKVQSCRTVLFPTAAHARWLSSGCSRCEVDGVRRR